MRRDERREIEEKNILEVHQSFGYDTTSYTITNISTRRI
jgi:hypothetical protein